MKKYILKREKVIHILSLVLVAISVFLNQEQSQLKIALLIAGVLGLIAVYYAKGSKLPLYIFITLLIFALIGYYLITNNLIQLS